MAHDPNSANQKQALVPKLGGMYQSWKLRRKKRVPKVPKVLSEGRQNSQNRILARTGRDEFTVKDPQSLVSRYKGYRKRKIQASTQKLISKPASYGGWKYNEDYLNG
ncbi:hypothetical protein CL634_00660 [bacterium]|nr:hypothetical protein [bacterium]